MPPDRDSGSAAVEFALVLPIVLMVALALVVVTRLAGRRVHAGHTAAGQLQHLLEGISRAVVDRV